MWPDVGLLAVADRQVLELELVGGRAVGDGRPRASAEALMPSTLPAHRIQAQLYARVHELSAGEARADSSPSHWPPQRRPPRMRSTPPARPATTARSTSASSTSTGSTRPTRRTWPRPARRTRSSTRGSSRPTARRARSAATSPATSARNHGNGCAGDIRYYPWGDTQGATVKPRAVHRAQRLDALGPRLDQRRRARSAARAS